VMITPQAVTPRPKPPSASPTTQQPTTPQPPATQPTRTAGGSPTTQPSAVPLTPGAAPTSTPGNSAQPANHAGSASSVPSSTTVVHQERPVVGKTKPRTDSLPVSQNASAPETQFWATVPGILTALAGVIGAIAALVGALRPRPK
jgi:hypothetical protein